MAKGNGGHPRTVSDYSCSLDPRIRALVLLAIFGFMSPQSPVGLPVLEARLVPDAPILDFKLPMFGPNGYKVWELRGREGHYINEEQIDVLDMSLRLYSGEADLKIHTTIESPAATMLVNRNRAEGQSEIKITGDQFQIRGENWRWHGDTHTVTVDKNVRVIFQQRLAGILK